MSPETRFEQTVALTVTEAGRGFVIYDEPRDRVHFVNSTAAAIYELCENACSVSQIAEELADGFDLEEPPIGEVGSCLEALEAEQLVRRV